MVWDAGDDIIVIIFLKMSLFFHWFLKNIFASYKILHWKIVQKSFITLKMFHSHLMHLVTRTVLLSLLLCTCALFFLLLLMFFYRFFVLFFCCCCFVLVNYHLPRTIYFLKELTELLKSESLQFITTFFQIINKLNIVPSFPSRSVYFCFISPFSDY